jgi:hypothetical protein
MGMNLASVCPTGFNTNPAECWRMVEASNACARKPDAPDFSSIQSSFAERGHVIPCRETSGRRTPPPITSRRETFWNRSLDAQSWYCATRFGTIDEPLDARESSSCCWAVVAHPLGPRDRGR